MGEMLVCRGPDSDGVWTSQHAAFAHRRLIVVDAEGGKQPMTKRVGERVYTLVYNGELYNTDELRERLIARGHVFQSYSDTEVVLTSFIEWGNACVDEFNGIFAFAIWDEHRQNLFMARDRLGVKPLFYSSTQSGLLFASELKALLKHPNVSSNVSKEGLAEIFAMGPARTPGHGVFADIKELRAGHLLEMNRLRCNIHQYWKLSSCPHVDDLETTTDRVRWLMVDTVIRQLVSDVPLATFLSGGLDSSVVSAIAARHFAETDRLPLQTYSIEFADMVQYFTANDYQKSLDAPWAKNVSDFIHSQHHAIVYDTPELMDHLLTPLGTRDLPGMADIDTSMYLFCRRIRQDVTVALSGESADEVFGGYPWFHREESLQADTFPWSLRMQERMRVMSPELIDWIAPETYVERRYQEALDEVPRLAGESAIDARIREISYLSITRFLPTLLDRKDRLSMASGLEVRVPFCDHRLVEYVFNIPWAMKAADGHIKGILRRAMKGYLPDEVLFRKKSPYPSTPSPDYLTGVRQRALAMLEDTSEPITEFISPAAVRALAKESETPHVHRPWFGQIMGTAQMFHYLVEVNEWMKRYQVRIV